ncbi:MAG: hypothetical protein IPL35_03370 [Sphingobacteriales bacterium]|nr:hypothetical protein [Sphingobacteriales bacterium]
MTALKQGIDFYINEQGLFVFTAHYLLQRGYCCGNGCKHCPYGKEEQKHRQLLKQQKKNNKKNTHL